MMSCYADCDANYDMIIDDIILNANICYYLFSMPTDSVPVRGLPTVSYTNRVCTLLLVNSVREGTGYCVDRVSVINS